MIRRLCLGRNVLDGESVTWRSSVITRPVLLFCNGVFVPCTNVPGIVLGWVLLMITASSVDGLPYLTLPCLPLPCLLPFALPFTLPYIISRRKLTKDRFLIEWEAEIVPAIKSGKRVLIVAHGNTIRGLCQHLDEISDDEITGLDIPTGKSTLVLPDTLPKQVVPKIVDGEFLTP